MVGLIMYLLDTCAVSDFVRGEVNTVARMHSIPATAIHISSVTLFEIEFGLVKTPSIAAKLMPIFMELFLKSDLISLDYRESILAGSIRHDLESVGKKIGPYDILIAATALVHDLTLVTSNIGEFSRIKGLKYENWRVYEDMIV
jgi:tRNA(fMet)-specific endonuclease VapC